MTMQRRSLGLGLRRRLSLGVGSPARSAGAAKAQLVRRARDLAPIDSEVVAAAHLCSEAEARQRLEQHAVVHRLVVALVLDGGVRVDEGEARVACGRRQVVLRANVGRLGGSRRGSEVAVDAATARRASRERDTVLFQQLDAALLPRILVLAYDDARPVAPEQQQRVADVDVLKEVLLGREVEQDVLRLGVEDVDRISRGRRGEKARPRTAGAEGTGAQRS
mmetsp:Transcript_25290/g.75266  ORF Transcript_25290/g.75266 Transcript_25290/m.75266 type:complete len:221 (+) Transcript_25290:451-1113(+)